jgi:pimeloyl-ACP methyl ester carboxylesterase
MKEYFLENKEIYYRKNDFMDGRPTLVFVHGVSGSSSAWWPYEKIFKDKYNILTYDIRGHGLSKKFPNYSDYKVENFASDLHNLISYLNISKFVLISHSFGTLVAAEYIRNWRDTVSANVFLSPEIHLDGELSAKIYRPILKILTGIIKLMSFNPKPRGHVDYSKHINSTDWNIKRNIADMKNTGLHAHFYTLRQSMAPGQDYCLDKICAPTLIMHGEKDTMAPIKNSIKMSREIKNCKFISIPDIDHNTVHNAVGKLSEAIRNFIEEQKMVI